MKKEEERLEREREIERIKMDKLAKIEQVWMKCVVNLVEPYTVKRKFFTRGKMFTNLASLQMVSKILPVKVLAVEKFD